MLLRIIEGLNLTKTVAIRFDVSSKVGTGHLRRAVAFGDELTQRQIQHYFVTQNSERRSAISLGIPENLLVDFDPELGESDWVRKIPGLTHVITDFCHSEHIFPNKTLGNILRAKETVTAVIDSMPPFHYQSDENSIPSLLVTPYFEANKLRDTPKCGAWLAGVEFAILDKIYPNLHSSLCKSSLKQGNFALICCGGSDPHQLSEYIVQTIFERHSPNVDIMLIIGNYFSQSRIIEFKKLARRNSKHLSLIFNKNNIADLINDCGALIGSVGMIRYEAACLGKPSFLVQNNSNHERYLKNFNRAGLGNIYFLQNRMERIAFESTVKKLSSRDSFFSSCKPNTQAFDVVDGNGVKRVLDAFF